ncbi:TPA: hypothetical protein ACQJX6_005940 [Raoultella ornithinolytica]
MKKPFIYKMLGPMKISFEYEITIGDKKFKDFYQGIIPGVKKENVNEQYLFNVLNERMNEIIDSIIKDNPSLFSDEEIKIHCKVDNYTHGFFDMDVHIDFKK